MFALNTNYALTTLYRYHAGKIDSTIVKDDTYGFTTASAASSADGMIFTTKFAGNLCTGTFTQNNINYMPVTDLNATTYYKKFVRMLNGNIENGKWYCSKAYYQIVNGIVVN